MWGPPSPLFCSLLCVQLLPRSVRTCCCANFWGAGMFIFSYTVPWDFLCCACILSLAWGKLRIFFVRISPPLFFLKRSEAVAAALPKYHPRVLMIWISSLHRAVYFCWNTFRSQCLRNLQWSSSCRSHWPRCLRRRSVAARLLGLRVRIPPGHGCPPIVSVVCCQVEVSAIGPIPRAREFYGVWFVWMLSWSFDKEVELAQYRLFCYKKKDQVSALTVPVCVCVCVTDRVHRGFRNSVSGSSIQIVTVVDLYGHSAGQCPLWGVFLF